MRSSSERPTEDSKRTQASSRAITEWRSGSRAQSESAYIATSRSSELPTRSSAAISLRGVPGRGSARLRICKRDHPLGPDLGDLAAGQAEGQLGEARVGVHRKCPTGFAGDLAAFLEDLDDLA